MLGKFDIVVANALSDIPSLDIRPRCCVTSPPYFNQRDYGTGKWEGGGAHCTHPQGVHAAGEDGACLCGAVWVDDQLGIEETPEEYAQNLVTVFRAVRDKLSDDGTLWLNLGDTYNSGGRGGYAGDSSTLKGSKEGLDQSMVGRQTNVSSLPDKNLLGIPWRVAFALQADGWILRSASPWLKRSCMPSNVSDRPSSALEYIFQFSKGQRYYCDMTAVRKAYGEDWWAARSSRGRSYRDTDPFFESIDQGITFGGDDEAWYQNASAPHGVIGVDDEIVAFDVTSEPTSEEHFAPYPTKLCGPCIMMGSSERGRCPRCKAAWVRVVEKTQVMRERPNSLTKRTGAEGTGNVCPNDVAGTRTRTMGWRPQCLPACGQYPRLGEWEEQPKEHHKPRMLDPRIAALQADLLALWAGLATEPDEVFDPFAGAGTTLLVACLLARNAVGYELNPKYAVLGRDRIGKRLRPNSYVPTTSGDQEAASLFS